MRDFHDAKAMAQTLRDGLAEKSVSVSHSESLELVSRALGVPDWNTLSAMIHTERKKSAGLSPDSPDTGPILPAIPVRDFVPFPTGIFPLYVGREETKRALDHAFANHREIALIIQKDPSTDNPSLADVHDVAVMGTLLEIERYRSPERVTFDGKELPTEMMKILVHAGKRVTLRRFFKESGAYRAEVGELAEPVVHEDAVAVRDAVELFKGYAAAHKLYVPQTWPAQAKQPNAGRVADFISSQLILPISEKYKLLATNDPTVRIGKVNAIMRLAESVA